MFLVRAIQIGFSVSIDDIDANCFGSVLSSSRICGIASSGRSAATPPGRM